MNSSRRGASGWTRFIIISRTPRHVAASYWSAVFLKKNGKKLKLWTSSFFFKSNEKNKKKLKLWTPFSLMGML